MEIKKCDQCGGNLERLRVQKAWRCPFCGARFEEGNVENMVASAEYFGLNEEVFLLESDLSKVMKKAGGSGCIRSIVHCMSTLQTAVQVEEYMLKKMPFSDDISTRPTWALRRWLATRKHLERHTREPSRWPGSS